MKVNFEISFKCYITSNNYSQLMSFRDFLQAFKDAKQWGLGSFPNFQKFCCFLGFCYQRVKIFKQVVIELLRPIFLLRLNFKFLYQTVVVMYQQAKIYDFVGQNKGDNQNVNISETKSVTYDFFLHKSSQKLRFCLKKKQV